MADHPLRPATRLSLGRPLPYQLADGTRTHPRVQPFMKRAAFPTALLLPTYAVLAILSDCYPPPKGRLSTCYAPVRHFTTGRSRILVRLACVRPAANVRSEPGSNSPIKLFGRLLGLLNVTEECFTIAVSYRNSQFMTAGPHGQSIVSAFETILMS